MLNNNRGSTILMTIVAATIVAATGFYSMQYSLSEKKMNNELEDDVQLIQLRKSAQQHFVNPDNCTGLLSDGDATLDVPLGSVNTIKPDGINANIDGAKKSLTADIKKVQKIKDGKEFNKFMKNYKPSSQLETKDYLLQDVKVEALSDPELVAEYGSFPNMRQVTLIYKQRYVNKGQEVFRHKLVKIPIALTVSGANVNGCMHARTVSAIADFCGSSGFDFDPVTKKCSGISDTTVDSNTDFVKERTCKLLGGKWTVDDESPSGKCEEISQDTMTLVIKGKDDGLCYVDTNGDRQCRNVFVDQRCPTGYYLSSFPADGKIDPEKNCKPFEVADGQRVCSACPAVEEKVCGTNKLTYANKCVAKCAGLLDTQITAGPCSGDSSSM